MVYEVIFLSYRNAVYLVNFFWTSFLFCRIPDVVLFFLGLLTLTNRFSVIHDEQLV